EAKALFVFGGPAEKADVEESQRVVVPVRRLRQENARLGMEAGAKLGINTEEPFGTPRPGLNRREVVELRHRTGRRSEEATSDPGFEIELVAIQNVPFHPERVGVG